VLSEGEWIKMKDDLYANKVPVLRVRGRNAKRAKDACEIQANCGEIGMWEVPAGRETRKLVKMMKEAGYESTQVLSMNVWCNSDYVHEALGNVRDEEDAERVGRIVGDAMLIELADRESDELSKMARHASDMDLEYIGADGRYRDEVSGKELNAEGVRRARQEEMEEFRKHGVYVKVPRQECMNETGKAPIKVRWLDINKGDELRPEYRSRLVAQEIKLDNRQDLFAATPPLEAKKLLFSWATTEGIGWSGIKEEGMKLDFIDVSRAYFHAPAIRKVYVELPDEDAEEGMVGLLMKSMYGTRDAAQNWNAEYTRFMESIGFERGDSCPCAFKCERRELRVVVHGDDFTALGWKESLDWFWSTLGQHYELKEAARL